MVVGTWNNFTQRRGTVRSKNKGPKPLLVLKCCVQMTLEDAAKMMPKKSSSKVSSNIEDALLHILPSPEAAMFEPSLGKSRGCGGLRRGL